MYNDMRTGHQRDSYQDNVRRMAAKKRRKNSYLDKGATSWVEDVPLKGGVWREDSKWPTSSSNSSVVPAANEDLFPTEEDLASHT